MNKQKPFPNQEMLKEYMLSKFKYLKGNIENKFSMSGHEHSLILRKYLGNQIVPIGNNITNKSRKYQRVEKVICKIIIQDTPDNRLLIRQKVTT